MRAAPVPFQASAPSTNNEYQKRLRKKFTLKRIAKNEPSSNVEGRSTGRGLAWAVNETAVTITRMAMTGTADRSPISPACPCFYARDIKCVDVLFKGDMPLPLK